MTGSPRGKAPRPDTLRRGSFLAGALLLAGAVLAAPAAAQDPCTPPTGDTGFAEVSVNLAAGSFNQVLPFDVPVRVCGTVPAGTENLTVQYAVSKSADLQMDSRCRILAPAGVALQPATAIPGRLDGTTFHVILPPLEAERYYAFCFQRRATIPPDLAAKLKSQARAILDRRLAEVTSGDLTAQQSLRLRQALRDQLAAAASADDLALTDGTVFDVSTGYDALRGAGKLNDLVARVVNPQRREERVIAGDPQQGVPSLAERQLDLKQDLKAVAGDPALAKLMGELQKTAQTDATVQELLASPSFKAATALLQADDAQLTLVAQGREPGSAATDLLDPEQDAALASRYDDTSAALGGLANLIRKVLAAPAGSTLRAGLTDADLADLQAVVAPQGALAKAADQAFTLSGLAQDLQTGLAERSAALDALAERVKAQALQVEAVDGTTTGNFATQQNNYISADAGLIYAPELNQGVSYVGMNFYFRPVNKNADLSQFGSFSRRFALTLALTVQSLADGGNGTIQTRDNLFASQSLVLGAGLRVTNSLRLGAGAVVFKKKDRDPLVSTYSVSSSYYLSLSFDLNVAKAFQGGLASLFGG